MASRKSQNSPMLLTLLAVVAAGAGGFYYVLADGPRERVVASTGETAAAVGNGLFGGLSGNATTAPSTVNGASLVAPKTVAVMPGRLWFYEQTEAERPNAAFGIPESDDSFGLTCGVEGLEFRLWQSELPEDAVLRVEAGDQVIEARWDSDNFKAMHNRAWLSAAAAFGFTIIHGSTPIDGAHSDVQFRKFANDCLAQIAG